MIVLHKPLNIRKKREFGNINDRLLINKKMTSEDLIKAINYLWNEEMGKEQHAGLQNEDSEKDKIEKGNENKEGDGEVKAAMDLWKMEKDEDKDHFKTMIDTGC